MDGLAKEFRREAYNSQHGFHANFIYILSID